MEYRTMDQYLNYMSVVHLEKLGNDHPSEQQIHLMEELLSRVSVLHHVCCADVLSKSEKCCLQLVSNGKTKDEIAGLMNLSTSTIKKYYRSIRTKLKSKTMAQAVFQGMRLGYINHKEISLELDSKII